MAGRRRYRVGEHQIYDRYFDKFDLESVILNPSRTDADANLDC